MNLGPLMGAILFGFTTLMVIRFYIHYIRTGVAFPSKEFGHVGYILCLLFFGGVFMAAVVSI